MKNQNTLINCIKLFLLICMLPSQSYSQKIDEKVPDEFNYFKIKEQNRKALNISKSDTTDDNQQVKNRRFEKFWDTRVGRNGDMREYSLKMQENYVLHQKSNNTTMNNVKVGCGDCCYPSNWTYFGPQSLRFQNLGKVNAVWVDPLNNLNILAGSDGGLFRTEDGGINWNCITDYSLPGTGILGITVESGSSNNTIYIATGFTNSASHNSNFFGYGIYKTINGGTTWTKMNISYGNPEDGVSYKVVINPADNNSVYAIVGSQLFKSINATDPIPVWTNIFNNIVHNSNKLQLVDLEVRPVNIVGVLSDEVYISSKSKMKQWSCIPIPISGTFNWGDISGYCTTEFTAKVWEISSPRNSASLTSFNDLTLTLPSYNPVTVEVAISLTPNSITIACQSNYDASPSYHPSQIKIYQKPLSITSWGIPRTINADFNYGFGFPFEVSSTDDNIMYYGGTVLYKSIDNGRTFNPLWNYWDFLTPSLNKAGCHADLRALSVYKSTSMPGNNDELFWGTDGGIGKTMNAGTTTQNLNGKGLQLTQFQGISNSEVVPNLVYGGTQDNGLMDNKLQTWSNYPLGDGYQCVVDDNQYPPRAYSTVNGNILTTTAGGGTWSYSYPCPPGGSCWNVPLYIDKNGNLFVCGLDVFKRNGTSWVNVTNLNLNSSISDIAVAKDGNSAYISYDFPLWGNPQVNKVFKITNLLTSPVVNDITAGLTGVDWACITNLATNETGTIVWASFGGLWSSNKKVFKFENNIWSEYGQGLPNIPANAIEYMSNSNDMLFLGMDDGVYFRDKSMSEWKEFKCGLPNTIISGLTINYATQKLRAATYSRGIFETSINQSIKLATCSNNISATYMVSNQTSTNNNLTDGITVPVLSRFANVTINLSNYCTGTTDCTKSQVNWKIFRDGNQIQMGTGSQISFDGIFRVGWWWWAYKHSYKVEVSIICGNTQCQTLTYNFN